MITYLVLGYYHLRVMMLPVTLIYGTLIFLTPVGLCWFSAGQTEIYPALAVLLFLFAVYESKDYAFFGAALAASLKWTVMPFFVQAWFLYLLCNKNTRKFEFFSIFALTFTLTLIVFPDQSWNFVQALYKAQHLIAMGSLSLVGRVPPQIILAATVIGPALFIAAFFWNRGRLHFEELFLPYITGFAVFDILLPSASFQYRVVSIVGFIPMIVVWFMKYSPDRIYRSGFVALFIVFLFLAFHGFWMIGENLIGGKSFIFVYMGYYLAIVTLTIGCFFKKKACAL